MEQTNDSITKVLDKKDNGNQTQKNQNNIIQIKFKIGSLRETWHCIKEATYNGFPPKTDLTDQENEINWKNVANVL